MPTKPDLPAVIATLKLQRWNTKEPEELEVVSEVKVDATAALLAAGCFGLRQLSDDSIAANRIIRSCNCPELDYHTGPFTVTMVDEVKRFLLAHGRPPGRFAEMMAAMTLADWAAIESKYAVTSHATLADASVAEVIAHSRLERILQVLHDTKKEISYNKHTGEWSWYDRDEADNPDARHGGFTTGLEAMQDAVSPYFEDAES